VQPDVKPGKYVYVVCSTRDDHFAEIAAVSIASLRLHSPHARVTVLMDRQTAKLDSPGVAAIRSNADHVVSVDCPGRTSIDRSRFLKTGIRSLVSGRFLYLDGDTIIMKSVDAIWKIDGDVAACPNLGIAGKPYFCQDEMPETSATLGWTLGSRRYLNSGVIYFADSQAALSVGEKYRTSWLEFNRVTGKPNDQLAFNHALDLVEANVAVLPLAYNAQITMNAMALRGAIIVHFFTGNFENSLETVAHQAAQRLKRDGILDTIAIQSAVASGNPWTQIDSYRKAIAAGHYGTLGKVALGRLMQRYRRSARTTM
jgi:lipopolysaccharide biosynthesis glycosyltransferase